MDIIITLVLSFFEWLCLFLFPIMILGYSFKGSYKAMALIAGMMSIFSLLLHHSPLLIPYIIILQILSALLLVRCFFANKMLEAFVITSIGYGFYIFIQMIIIEFLVRAFSWRYFNFLSDIFNKTSTQLMTIIFLIFTCLLVKQSTYQLNEVRSMIKGPRMNKKHRILISLISVSTVAFICSTAYILLSEDTAYKELSILLVMVIGFITLTFYLFLHIQFQKQQILEAKTLFLDQEKQIIDQIGYLREEENRHFQAVAKLIEREAYELIPDYIKTNQLDASLSKIPIMSSLTSQLDELLHVFLTNKSKLGQFFGVSIKVSVSGEGHQETSISLQQIVCISKLMDDCIFMLFQAPDVQEKTIYFHIEVTEESIEYTISSPFYIKEKVHENLKSYDALLHLKHLGASIQSDFQPIHLSIRSPIL